MTHNQEQPPRNKHEKGTLGADEISVDALKKRLVSGNSKSGYSFSDEYAKTLSAVDQTVNGNMSRNEQFEQSKNAFDKTLAKYGISPRETTVEASDESTPAPAVIDNDMSLEEYREQVAGVTKKDLTASDKELLDRWSGNEGDDEIVDALESVDEEAHESDENYELDDDEIARIMGEVNEEADALALAGMENVDNEAEELANKPATLELVASELPREHRLNLLKKLTFNKEEARKRWDARQEIKRSIRESYSNGRERVRNGRLKPAAFFGAIMGRINLLRNRLMPQVELNEQVDLADSQVEQFNDGSSALLYDKNGSVMTLGPDSKEKYGRHFAANESVNDIAIITTESGKKYGMTRGFLIDQSNGHSYDLPNDTFDVTIGKKIRLPGVGKLDKVKSVRLRYKDYSDDKMDTRGPSPFTYFTRAAADTRAQARRAA